MQQPTNAMGERKESLKDGGQFIDKKNDEEQLCSNPDVESKLQKEEQEEEEVLARAKLVIEGDDEKKKDVIYAKDAKEYDPNAKIPIYRNRRFQCHAILFCTIALLIVAGVIVGVTRYEPPEVVVTETPTIAPTQAPTTLRESELRRVFVETLGGRFEPGSLHDHAAKWMIEDDPMQLQADADNLVQRYTLALFWFQTTNGGTQEWLSCNRPSGGGQNETCIYQRFDEWGDEGLVYTPVDGIRWLSKEHECNWTGVFCYNNVVGGLHLEGQGLVGTLPTELTNLPYLFLIALPHNLLTGTIPSEWSDLHELREVNVLNNTLSGQMPADFFRRGSKIMFLNPSMNNISGTIPSSIGYLSRLQELSIFGTNIEGTIPSEIGNIRDLSILYIYHNQISGPIPTEIGRCRELVDVYLSERHFHGEIPSEFGNLDKVEWLGIIDSNGISGTIPEQFYNMTALRGLSLDSLGLEGTLSTRIGLLSNLTTLDISENNFNGTIPTNLANLSGLQMIGLNHNRFVGAVPSGLCTIPNAFIEADCGADDDTGAVPNPCDCCAGCCQRDSNPPICFREDV